MGVLNTVAVDQPDMLFAAMAIVEDAVGEIDAVCSRFRDDSELMELNRRAGLGDFPLSAVMEGALLAAMATAEMTKGLVDPTIGKCVEEVGYTMTFGALPADGPALALRVHTVPGWRALVHDKDGHTLRIPSNTALDLGASAKAWAADRAASRVTGELGIGVLVECGGDVSISGPSPANGWPVRIASDVDASDGLGVVLRDGGLATSGTTSRRWRRGGVELHDIIDPATGLPVETPWSMVTVAAATCLEANAAATAALISGDTAVAWLNVLNLPARLVTSDGDVVHAGGWAA